MAFYCALWCVTVNNFVVLAWFVADLFLRIACLLIAANCACSATASTPTLPCQAGRSVIAAAQDFLLRFAVHWFLAQCRQRPEPLR